jgi:hypothetical protein
MAGNQNSFSRLCLLILFLAGPAAVHAQCWYSDSISSPRSHLTGESLPLEIHCTEANVLQKDTFWLRSRSLEIEIWSPAREASMRVQNKIYEEHVKSFQGAHCLILNCPDLKTQISFNLKKVISQIY